jgi:hypothetical protein
LRLKSPRIVSSIDISFSSNVTYVNSNIGSKTCQVVSKLKNNLS